MTITVVIATYNRSRLLDECLAHLSQQHFLPGDQAIVVDNGSTDDTPAVIARQQQRFPVPLTHLEERQPGKSRALARGLQAATGDVLAFTDDDVNVGPTWMDDIRRTMGDRDIALMGGPVAPRWEARPRKWLAFADGPYGRLAAPLGLLDYGADATELGARTVLGANLAVRREILKSVGGFDSRLGKLRGTLLSGEDHELCRRVQAEGFRAIYCPEARVFHRVPAERMRVGYFLAWFFWFGITHAALDSGAVSPRSIGGLPLYLIRRFFLSILGAATALVTANTTAAMEHATETAFAMGYAAKRWHLMGRDAARPAWPAGAAV